MKIFVVEATLTTNTMDEKWGARQLYDNLREAMGTFEYYVVDKGGKARIRYADVTEWDTIESNYTDNY